jgi:GT2 family glycosyltransferase
LVQGCQFDAEPDLDTAGRCIFYQPGEDFLRVNDHGVRGVQRPVDGTGVRLYFPQLFFVHDFHVGAVGVKLLFPNNTIQHAGVIIGMRGVASHAFYGLPASDPGYMGLATVTRNCAAVTAACLMLRRSVFEEVGGFDEELDVAYNDVDLCLRIIQRGYYIVWTPHAVLYHHESASRGQYQPECNIRYFCEKWRSFLEKGDPFYNPNLALDRADFMVKI